MAMKIKWEAGMDGAIAVAGAGILQKYLVGNVEALSTALANIPSFPDVGIASGTMVLLGAAALITYKTFAK